MCSLLFDRGDRIDGERWADRRLGVLAERIQRSWHTGCWDDQPRSGRAKSVGVIPISSIVPDLSASNVS